MPYSSSRSLFFLSLSLCCLISALKFNYFNFSYFHTCFFALACLLDARGRADCVCVCVCVLSAVNTPLLALLSLCLFLDTYLSFLAFSVDYKALISAHTHTHTQLALLLNRNNCSRSHTPPPLIVAFKTNLAKYKQPCAIARCPLPPFPARQQPGQNAAL